MRSTRGRCILSSLFFSCGALIPTPEDRFGNHDVDADVAIHQLGDAYVTGHADKPIRLHPGPAEAAGDEVDRVLDGGRRRLSESLLHPHRDEMRPLSSAR